MGSYTLHWEPLLRGHFAIGHRPGKKLRAALEQAGCTHTVSLLSERESSKVATERRLRLPLDSADPPPASRDADVRRLFERLRAILDTDGARVYLHCSAGLHRTGMVGYAFLRYLGMDAEAALAFLTRLRALTAQEVREHRLAWGERWVREQERDAR